MVYTFLGPHLKYEVAVKVSLGQQTVVGSAQKSDVFYCVWPSEGIGVLMMKLEHARRLAAATGVTDKGAASPVPFDHLASHLGRNVAAVAYGQLVG